MIILAPGRGSLLRPLVAIRLASFVLLACLLPLVSCGAYNSRPPAGTVVFLIENMPTNLDPRIGTDAQSQYLDGLLFDSLVQRNDRMQIIPDLATSWETPNLQTYIFHLRRGVRFHNGEPLTAADVKFTFESMIDGSLKTPKGGRGLALITAIDTPDPYTVIFHLRQPYVSFLTDIVRPALGIVPRPTSASTLPNPAEDPIGTGPFRFVRSVIDQEVVLERNPDYFGQVPKISRVVFRVVPDAITRALELRKGSADIELNSLTPDMVDALGRTPGIQITDEPGTIVYYVAFNCSDPVLRHRRVRQALAYATDRQEIIRYLLRGQARIAYGLLPPNHWAYDGDVPHYDFDPARANQLLDGAGFRRGPEGVRFHITLKTSTDALARLLGATLQQQWRRVGVVLDLRSLEFGTFYADITRGSFQLYTLRWIGANTDPGIFDYVFDSREFPPIGANRGHYDNPMVDRLLDQARMEAKQQERARIYAQVQEIIARDEPYLDLWYKDNVSVHRERVANVHVSPIGGFDFLAGITLRGDGER